MGLYHDFFGGKSAAKPGKVLTKYNEEEQSGRLKLERRLKNVKYQDRKKLREMFVRHHSLEHGQKLTNRRISKMMKADFGYPGSMFRKRIKQRVLSRQEVVPSGLSAEQIKNRALAFRYDRAAEEEGKQRKGPQFANAFLYRHESKSAEKTLPGITGNPVGVRGNNPADRVQYNLKDNPHLGL